MAASVWESHHSHVVWDHQNRGGYCNTSCTQCQRTFLTVAAAWAKALICRMITFSTTPGCFLHNCKIFEILQKWLVLWCINSMTPHWTRKHASTPSTYAKEMIIFMGDKFYQNLCFLGDCEWQHLKDCLFLVSGIQFKTVTIDITCLMA